MPNQPIKEKTISVVYRHSSLDFHVVDQIIRLRQNIAADGYTISHQVVTTIVQHPRAKLSEVPVFYSQDFSTAEEFFDGQKTRDVVCKPKMHIPFHNDNFSAVPSVSPISFSTSK